MSIDDNYYYTSDLGLATALLTSGAVLVRVDTENPKRAVFIFVKSTELDAVVDDFWTGTLLVSARRYFENTKMLKSRIYGG